MMNMTYSFLFALQQTYRLKMKANLTCDFKGLVFKTSTVQSSQLSDDRKWEEMSQEAGRQSKLGMTRHSRFQMCLCVCYARKLH